MPPRVYRKTTTSSGGASVNSLDKQELGFVGRQGGMSGISPFSLPPISQQPIAPSGSSPLGSQRYSPPSTSQRRSPVLNAPAGLLPPIGGEVGKRFQKMVDFRANLEPAFTAPPPPRRLAPLQVSSSVPAPVPAPAPRPPRRLPPLQFSSSAPAPKTEEFSKGGSVKRTGMAKVHKGEVIIPKSRVKAVEKAVKKAGLKSIKAPIK